MIPSYGILHSEVLRCVLNAKAGNVCMAAGLGVRAPHSALWGWRGVHISEFLRCSQKTGQYTVQL